MFRTTDMALAAYLIVARRLNFVRIEAVSSTQAELIFDDPHNVGGQIEVEFLNGAQAPASEFHQKTKYLRSRINSAVRNFTLSTVVCRG